MISGARYQRVATYPVISSSVCLANPKSRICGTSRHVFLLVEFLGRMCDGFVDVNRRPGSPLAHSPRSLLHYLASGPGKDSKTDRGRGENMYLQLKSTTLEIIIAFLCLFVFFIYNFAAQSILSLVVVSDWLFYLWLNVAFHSTEFHQRHIFNPKHI